MHSRCCQVGNLLHAVVISSAALFSLALPLMVVVWFGNSPDLFGEFVAIFVPPFLVRRARAHARTVQAALTATRVPPPTAS
jgi:hypothetical protein